MHFKNENIFKRSDLCLSFLFAVQELSKDGLHAEPPPLLADILDLHICVILHWWFKIKCISLKMYLIKALSLLPELYDEHQNKLSFYK